MKCTINGIEYSFKKGQTIMEIFKQNNVEISHYCWHPGLSVAGVCRLCMVDIEGMPKIQIACNTQAQDGMKVNNNSNKIDEAVKWGLAFHLLDHPLDCPICDQAGECELQEQYMKYGQYDTEMRVRKTKKRKAVDLGSKIVLDTERCILCSRCVRFTDEVTKTHELGIFERGDRSEIGTFKDMPLENDYSVNTVDICPVGALTSKEFRFRQRVWFLKEAPSVCVGCSTGCNISVHYNKQAAFRIKPRYNEEINQFWMCDHGRKVYDWISPENRTEEAYYLQSGKTIKWEASHLVEEFAHHWKNLEAKKVAVLITGQYTVEEITSVVEFFQKEEVSDLYHWWPKEHQNGSFDKLLIRGDKNPNTKGLQKVFADKKIKIAHKEGMLNLEELQLPNKKRMQAQALLNGFTFKNGAEVL